MFICSEYHLCIWEGKKTRTQNSSLWRWTIQNHLCLRSESRIYVPSLQSRKTSFFNPDLCIICSQRLGQEDFVQAGTEAFSTSCAYKLWSFWGSGDQPRPTAEKKWIVTVCSSLFCVFYLTCCLSEATTGHSVSVPGTVAPAPSPRDAGRPAGSQTAQMAGLQGAHFLRECSAGSAENQLENQVSVWITQWSPAWGFFTGAWAAKRSQEEFSSMSGWSLRPDKLLLLRRRFFNLFIYLEHVYGEDFSSSCPTYS